MNDKQPRRAREPRWRCCLGPGGHTTRRNSSGATRRWRRKWDGGVPRLPNVPRLVSGVLSALAPGSSEGREDGLGACRRFGATGGGQSTAFDRYHAMRTEREWDLGDLCLRNRVPAIFRPETTSGHGT